MEESNDDLSIEELNRRVAIHIKKINLMMKRNQISNLELLRIRFESYPIAKRQWKLPPELEHLREIYDATDPADFVSNFRMPTPPQRRNRKPPEGEGQD